MTGKHNSTTYLFAGGGTGGHIFPAIAIAEELLARDAASRCRFLVSSRPLDEKILRGQKLAIQDRQISPEFDTIPAQPFGLRLRSLLRFLNSWGKSVRTVRRIIRDAKENSNVVLVAMGGFVAAPCVQAARAEKVPIVLVNLDAVPGKANRWIGRHAHDIVTAAPIAPHLKGTWQKWKQIAPIVRRGAAWIASKREARIALGLNPDRPTLMITGGSQGAGTINAFVRDFVSTAEVEQGSLRCGQQDGWQILHQVGPQQSDSAIDESLRTLYREKGIPAVVSAFVDNLGVWWGASDLVICRSGAGNVGEVWANKVPALFLPYPFHKDEHQKFNAGTLEQSGGAIVLKDTASSENLRTAGPVLASLLIDTAKLNAMQSALETLGPADGATRAADMISSIAQRS